MSREIALTQGKFAIVDDEDYEEISLFKWHAALRWRTWYAERATPKSEGLARTTSIHRQLLNPGSSFIDHINGNGLDNRRENLRLCDSRTNTYNRQKHMNCSSLFKGVYLHKASGMWRAQIKLNGIRRSLGAFKLEIEAALAYDKAARDSFGEFAKLNFEEVES